MKNNRISYKQLNNSFFKKQAIYPLTNRGFFSEINNLALAALYCLKNNIHLKIYTKNWVSGNWNDYFHPVLEEYNGIIPIPSLSIFNIKNKELPYKFYHKNIKNRILAQDTLWKKMREKKFLENYFYFPSLNIDGDIFEAKKQILNILLDYKPFLIKEIYKDYLPIEKYIESSCGIHIRRGDKVNGISKETDITPIESYITKALEISPSLNKFTICTDDYNVVIEFKNKFPNYSFFTLCDKKRNGYYQKKINNSKKEIVKNEVINILKDSYLLSKSKIFIGTNSSNISRFVTLNRNNKKCYSMDLNWYPL